MVTAIQRPSLVAAEVAWRWSFGAAALVLATAAFAGFLDGLAVTDRDLLALGSRNRDLVAAAITHIFEGAGPRLLRALVALAPALALLWSVAASLGRTITLRALIPVMGKVRWHSILVLHLGRALLVLATLFAVVGIIVFGASISSSPDDDGFLRPNEATFLLILLFTLPALALFSSFLSWILSLAPLFVIRDSASAATSLVLAARLFRERRAGLLGTAALFAVLRVVTLGAVLTGALFLVAALPAAGVRVTLAALIVLALGYFVVADFLYVARLIANIEICQVQTSTEAAVEKPSEILPDSTSPAEASAT